MPGLPARANRGVLYVDEVNLLDYHLVEVRWKTWPMLRLFYKIQFSNDENDDIPPPRDAIHEGL